MQYSRTKKIIVDEYDQLCNSGMFRVFKQQYTRCQMCQQEIPLKLIISHQNVCEVESKQEESQGYEKYNENIPENNQNKNMRNAKLKSSKKRGPSRPASVRNQYDSKYNACTVKLSPRKRCFDSIGSEKKCKPSSSASKYSHRKNKANLSKMKLKEFNNPLNCSIKIKDRAEKIEGHPITKKHREVATKNIIGIRNDSKLLRQSIDSRLTKPRENPYIKNSTIKDEQRSKVKKKKINRSMISEGYNEYYEQTRPQLKKTNTSKKSNHKSRSKEKCIGSKKKAKLNQRESTDPEYYFDDQKGKIKAIEKQRERLRKEKQKILHEIEQQKKRKEEQQERIQEQERERRRQQQREQERNRTSRNNQGNNRRNRNRIFRSRRQQRQTQFFTEESMFESENLPQENTFNFISETMNAQFEMMKEQFNQMNQIFCNFRPFNQNQFVFFERNSDSSSYFSDSQSDQEFEFDENINEEEEQGLTPDQIQTLNSFIYQRRLGIDDQCTVCLNSIRNNQQVRRLPCTHIFHISCIDQWLQKKTSCPICREDILNSLN